MAIITDLLDPLFRQRVFLVLIHPPSLLARTYNLPVFIKITNSTRQIFSRFKYLEIHLFCDCLFKKFHQDLPVSLKNNTRTHKIIAYFLYAAKNNIE